MPVRPRFSYAMVEAGSADNVQPRVYRDCRGLGSGEPHRLTLRMLTDLNRIAVSRYEGFAAHAGVVASNGSAIALPADSKGGKSTLTTGAVMAGFDYVSDEALCVDIESSEIVPYPKPIMLSAESCYLLGIEPPEDDADWVERAVTAGDLGGDAVTSTRKLAHVVFPEYGHSGPAQLTSLPASQAVAGLLQMSFNHYKTPADSFRLATSLAGTAQTWRLTYSDPVEAGQLLFDQLGQV
jgi:hypothetical protein